MNDVMPSYYKYLTNRNKNLFFDGSKFNETNKLKYWSLRFSSTNNNYYLQCSNKCKLLMKLKLNLQNKQKYIYYHTLSKKNNENLIKAAMKNKM